MADEIRMKDIAKRLGISIVSVSKALNGEKGVSEDTRMRVRALAVEMGYQGPLRQRKDQDRRYTLGVLIPSRYLTVTETFYLRLYQSVARQAAGMRCSVLMETLEEEQARQGVLPHLMTDDHVDGMILLGSPPFDYAARMRPEWRKPVVYLDFSAPGADMDAVLSNNVYGMAAMTEYLIQRGHKDIGFLGTLNVTDSVNDRYLGYCRAMIRNGLPLRPDWRIDDRDRVSGSLYEIQLPQDMPTAFVCNCDMTANRLIRVLEKHGLSVPGDVSVVGFDDYLPAADETTVALTTWAADTAAMARLVVKMLLKRVNGEDGYPIQQITNGHLVQRETVRDITNENVEFASAEGDR